MRALPESTCTRLGIPLEEMGLAVKDLWLSIWDERVLNYHATSGLSGTPPAMAVVIQPLLEALAAGVAYSIHPLTGRATQVVINAVAGLAAALVDGRATPDQYVVEMAENSQPIRIQRTDDHRADSGVAGDWPGSSRSAAVG